MAEEVTQNQEELSAETPIGKFKARGSDILGVMQIVIISIIAFGGWEHSVDAKEDNKTLAQAIKENTLAQQQQVAAQREANCLNRLTPEQKRNIREIEFCRQLGKER